MRCNSVVHNSAGMGGNVLCCNGNAWRKATNQSKYVTCPACLMIMETGCSPVDAIKAWEK
jgi:hypothetical protein